MWKSVIRFDNRAANFQGRRPVLLLHGHCGSVSPSITCVVSRSFSRDAHVRSGVPSGSDSVNSCGPNDGEKISEAAETRCPVTQDRKDAANVEHGQLKRTTWSVSSCGVIQFPRLSPEATHTGRLLDGATDIGKEGFEKSVFAIHPRLVHPVGTYACCDGSGVLDRGDVSSGEQRARPRSGATPIVNHFGSLQGFPISFGMDCNGCMSGFFPSRRSFAFWNRSGNKDKDTPGTPASRGSAVTSWTKGRSLTRGLMSLSYHLVRWAVVLPFRLGKWTIHLVSLTFKAVGHLMSLCARAAVVARVGGVSGIFKSIMGGIKHTVHWCKTGFRLYFANVKVSYYILLKRLKGHPMRYNERKLLMNTLNDALKLVPFSFFLIVPFAELLLPVAIRLFPQMLPSTFRTDNSKSDDYLQKKLLAKKELAQFFQELVQERTNQLLQDELDSSLKTKMEALKDFQERILNKKDRDINPFLSSNELLVFAKIFKKEFKLDQMNLETLKVMCKLLGITPFSVRSHVVLQLRHHLLKIQREDRLIMWEGVESLSTEELQEACRDRAMKFYNISREQLQQQLKQWLDLSSMRQISPILLLWSRCITMTHEPMAIKADDEGTAEDKLAIPETAAVEVADSSDSAVEATKPTKVGEKFAEEVTTAQKASSTRIMKAVTAAAEVDAQKLVSKEERLEELSLKAKELKDIIDGNVKPCEGEELVDGATSLDDPTPGELLEVHSSEDMLMHLHEDHVIRHAEEIKHLNALGKKEILVRHEELLSALHIQRQITDLQHNQLAEMYMFLLKVSEDLNAGVECNIKDAVNDLVVAARQELEKIEELTCQFDKHNLTYEPQASTPTPVSSTT
ncbi:LETM1-like protein, putative [Babesia bigemina]|uniref:LETM1-like protein, putative n=1 Tax=Babesia bigemina TaxID=5866 RepID=A0A061D3P1_BABBI|nr:LETM1-like protein, putative [Babesia bigemina]CDR95311.1 LETM1-like protein, putative [Babesia bigemina]|eukprot:XP_012767497.1 LETM1-like protein, putative [Babesia bigemina]